MYFGKKERKLTHNTLMETLFMHTCFCKCFISIVGEKCIYRGREASFEFKDFLPFTQYCFKVRAFTEGDESGYSDVTTIITEEEGKRTICILFRKSCVELVLAQYKGFNILKQFLDRHRMSASLEALQRC